MAEPSSTASTFGVYRRLLGARIRSDLSYRASFAMRLLTTVLVTSMDFAVIGILFSRIDRLGGWSLAEVAFLYGVAGLSFNLADASLGAVDYLGLRVKQGTFDRLLVRPLSPLGQLLVEEFALRRIGAAFQSGAVFVAALAFTDIAWTPAKAAWLAVMLVAAYVIYGGIWIATASVSFWVVDSKEFANAFTYGGNYLAQYPIKVYSEWLRRFFSFVIPTAFVAYFPSLYLLDRMSREDLLGLPRAVVFASPAVAVATWAVAMAVWRAGLRHYRSTGS